MPVMRATTFLPMRLPVSTMTSARRIESSSCFIKAPEPVFTSSTSASMPSASFLLMMDAQMRPIFSTVAVTSRSAEIAPADKKIYALRDVTATVENIGLICASIMSKKLAEGIDALVLDVKTGSGAFMKQEEDSIRLAEVMVETGKRMGKKVVAFITGMDQPLGRFHHDLDRKSTRLNSSHLVISYAVF